MNKLADETSVAMPVGVATSVSSTPVRERRPVITPPAQEVQPDEIVVVAPAVPKLIPNAFWLATALLALRLGTVATMLFFTVTMVTAAYQAAMTWPESRPHVDSRVAAIGTAAVSFCGVFDFGIVVIAAVAAAAFGFLTSSVQPKRFHVVRSVLFPVVFGFAGASPALLLHTFSIKDWPALALVVLVTVYDTSMFLMGTQAATEWEGPTAATAAVFVFALILAVFMGTDQSSSLIWILAAGAAGSVLLGERIALWFVGARPGPKNAIWRSDGFLVAGPMLLLLTFVF